MDLKGKKILVTGGAGFIGRHLVNILLENGASIIVVDDFTKAVSQSFQEEVALANIKLPGPEFSEILKKENPFAVFHLAGTSYVPPSIEFPLKDLQSNAEVTLSVLEALRIVNPDIRLIYFSSAVVYGNPQKLPIRENDLLDPISPYGISKLASERYVFVYAYIHKIKTASLRLFSVYGPGQTKQVVFDLIDKLHKNPDELFVYGNGSEVRDFIYVEDVANAGLTVLGEGKLKGEVYNVSSGQPISIRELVETIAKIMNIKPNIVFSGQVRPGDSLRWEADISRIREIGFNPSISIEEGLRKTIDWYINTVPKS